MLYPCHHRLPAKLREAGATFVEFALVSLIIFLMLLALIDTGRYLFYEVVLTRAAEQAVNWAKKESRLTSDIRTISNPSEESLAAYANARNEAVDIATRFARTQFHPSAAENEKKLILMRMPDPENGWVPAAGAVELDAALIMPGQTIQVITINSAGEEVVRDINHPTCSAAQSCGQLSIAGSDGWEKLLIDHPLVVQVRAQFPLYLLLGQADIEIIGQAAAWQERVPIGTSPAPNVSPTATVSIQPTPVPLPMPCSAIGEAAACSGKCTQPWETCIFQPNNMTPNCTTCGLKQCSQWTKAADWCKNNGSCADYQTCSFNPNGTGNACETCTFKYCKDWTNQAQFCTSNLNNCPSADNTLYCYYSPYSAAPNCGHCEPKACKDWKPQAQFCNDVLGNCPSADNSKYCYYSAYSSAPNCGHCEPKACKDWKPQAEFCASINCATSDNSKYCYYSPYSTAPNCGHCEPKACKDWKPEAQFCASINCATSDGSKYCYYSPYSTAPNCGHCEPKACKDWKPEAQFCATLNNCASSDGSQYCYYSPYSTAPNCGHCEPKACKDWKTEAEFCATLNNCAGAGNLQYCYYSPYSTAPNCGHCEPKMCKDWKTQAQWCAEHGCTLPWQTCGYSAYSYAPDCGTGACTDAVCSAWTNAAAACAGISCHSNQTCEFLPNNVGRNCARCREKVCSDVTTQAAACAAIGCDLNYNTCTWDPNSTNLATCGATCTPKPCSQLTQSQVCYAGRCSAYQTCSVNPSGTPPNNCYSCAAVLCSAWTTQSAICSKCAPGQVCQWLPNNPAPNCGACANVCVGSCKPGEIWDPVHCRCVGSS